MRNVQPQTASAKIVLRHREMAQKLFMWDTNLATVLLSLFDKNSIMVINKGEF